MKRDFQPVRVLEVDLGEALPDLPPNDPSGAVTWGRALVLVRLHGHPLGTVELELPEGGTGAAVLSRAIWASLGAEILSHLRSDGLPETTDVGPSGLRSEGTPSCAQEREALLEDAPPVSVVISTRDRPDVLARALRSLLAVEYPRYEVIVVDNAPSSNATERLVRHDFGTAPNLRYVRERRPGLSRARNRGVKEAGGEIVAFTDDDVVVDRYWLAGLARGFRSAENVGCVTGLVMPLELSTQPQLWFEEFGGFGKGFQRKLYDLAGNRPRSPLFPYAAGQFGSGNNMAFRVQAIRDIGYFDTALGAGSPTFGGEDLAAFVAVLRKGYALAYEPSAIVHHQHRRDYEGLRKHIYDCGVGLTAYLLRSAIDSPRALLEFMVKVPFGAYYALSASSPKNRKKRANYPAELTAIERKGMLLGPAAYLRARWSDWRSGGRMRVLRPGPAGARGREVEARDDLKVG